MLGIGCAWRDACGFAALVPLASFPRRLRSSLPPLLQECLEPFEVVIRRLWGSSRFFAVVPRRSGVFELHAAGRDFQAKPSTR